MIKLACKSDMSNFVSALRSIRMSLTLLLTGVIKSHLFHLTADNVGNFSWYLDVFRRNLCFRVGRSP